MATINGANGDDNGAQNGLPALYDTADGDQVNGLDGNDVINITHASSADGGNGNDGIAVDLSAANTAINWNIMMNFAYGAQSFTNFEYFTNLKTGSGNDVVVTGNGSFQDTVAAGAGDDTITTYGGDTIDGGLGNDTLIIDIRVATFNDHATYPYNNSFAVNTDGGGGLDGNYYGVVGFSSIERFIIYGGVLGDTWATYNGDDQIYGGSGNETIYAGAGANIVDGGGGYDTISADLSAVTSAIVWNLQTGVYSGPGSYTNVEKFGSPSTDLSYGNFPISSQGGLYTGSGDDVITEAAIPVVTPDGATSIMTVNTAAGNDTVTVVNGTTRLNMGTGIDTLILDFSLAASAVSTRSVTSAVGAPSVDTDFGGSFDGQFRFAGTTGVRAGRVDYYGVEKFVITSGSGDDALITGSGDDIVNSGLGNDTISAAGGNDTLNPGLGTDVVNGGAGNDRLILDYSSATNAVTSISAPTANVGTGGFDGHYGDGTAAFDVTYTSIEAFTITGGSGNDVITTANGDDILDGGAGADTLTGGAGNDLYYVDNAGDVVVENANEGTDEIRTALASYALAANVEILTGTGTAQTLTGNALNNTITGTSGNDIIDGGTGADTMIGGAGNDVYYVDNAGDVVTEAGGPGGGTDEVRTTLASYTLAANVENLVGLLTTGQALSGNALDNTITGGTGNDTLNGGGGADRLIGGAGDDTYVIDVLGATIVEATNGGTDTIATSLASYTLATANAENLTGTATTGQALTGDGNANVITGGVGNDTLDGGGGADTLIGGLGDDIYIVRDASVTVTEGLNAGTDEVRTDLATYTLGANIEKLTGIGANDQTLIGNALDNVITSNDSNDRLDGGLGADTMAGGAGNDTYVVDNLGDVVTEGVNQGTDTVETALAAYTLAANVENLTGTNTSVGQALTGNALDNVITGTAFADRIDGGGGADTLIGGDGNDVYVINSATSPTITEAANGGTDTIETGLASFSLAGFANVENLTGTSATGQVLTGDAGANTITGGAGNDTLDGGGGTDRLVGGLGDDIYIVDSLDDVVVENANEGFDTVRTSISNYVLPANIEQLIYTGPGAGSLSGNAGDNMLTGATGNDYFDASQGGNDTLSGGGGNDGFYFGAAFTGDDRVDGGTGTNDQIGLNGDYTGANRVVLQAATITGVELIAVAAGFNYDITTVDANVAAGQVLAIYGSELGAGDALTFNGSAETSGMFRVYGGLGADNITTGGGNDGIYFGAGRFNVATDHVDAGGGANDQMALDGTYTGLTIARANVVNVEMLVLLDGQPAHADYSIALADDWTQGAEVHTVYAVTVRNGVTVDGSAETDSALRFYGGAGNDTLTGGVDTTSGSNWFDGGAGADTMKGGAGVDTFYYSTAANSMGVNYDKIVNFDQSQDKITVPFAVSGIDSAKAGSLSTASFDSDLASALATLGANHAVQFTANGGTPNGHIFEVIDANGIAGYQAGQDMVIELVTPTAPITTIAPFL